MYFWGILPDPEVVPDFRGLKADKSNRQLTDESKSTMRTRMDHAVNQSLENAIACNKKTVRQAYRANADNLCAFDNMVRVSRNPGGISEYKAQRISGNPANLKGCDVCCFSLAVITLMQANSSSTELLKTISTIHRRIPCPNQTP